MLLSWKDSENNCVDLRKSDHAKSAGGLEKIRPSWPFFFFLLFLAVEMSLGPHKVIKAERTFIGVDLQTSYFLWNQQEITAFHLVKLTRPTVSWLS